MRLADSPEEAAWRKEVRDFLESELPESLQSFGNERVGLRSEPEAGPITSRAGGSGFRMPSGDMETWRQKLATKGWIAPAWPKEYGGAGLTTIEQFIYNQEMAEVAAPMPGGMGVSMIGPTMIVHGTDEQKAEHLPKILSGEVAWAQGYSEPGAGSDLASLQTRAVRDGDEYVVNGQKIWTSGGHQADWLFALVRTDPEAPKHRGISFLVMDIKSPGLSLRPLINMGWKHHFNETFFEDVRVPVKNRIGEENRGWYVGMTLLDFERSGIAGAISYKRSLDQVKKFLDSSEGKTFRRKDFDAVRLEMADRAIETQILFNFAFRIVSIQNRGLVPNYEASVNKMYGAELHQRLSRTETKAWGLYGNVWDPKSKYAPMKAEHVQDYVGSVPHTIFSGSNEIQRNVIATRGLGLPRG